MEFLTINLYHSTPQIIIQVKENTENWQVAE